MAQKRRLLWQIYPTYVLIIAVSLIAATLFAAGALKRFNIEQSTADLEARARLVEPQIREYMAPLDEVQLDHACKRVGKRATTRITIILPSGHVVGDSTRDPSEMDNHRNRPEVLQAMSGEIGNAVRFSYTLQKDMMYVALPLKSGSEIEGVLRTAIPLASIYSATGGVQAIIVVGALLVAVLAAAISLAVSRRITKPIEEIRRGAERFARGEFEHQLPDVGSEEIGGLAETMNAMASELHDRIRTITRQREELEAVLSSMIEGVLAVDTDERIISLNEAAGGIFGADPSKSRGRQLLEVVRNADLQAFVMSALSSETPVEKDIVLVSGAGNERFLNGHGTPLYGDNSSRIGALIVLNDITRLMRLERVRKEFVANVSHEIRTPITAIKGFVETLHDGAISNETDARRFLEIVLKHVDRLNAIVEDLLSLSKIEQEEDSNAIRLSLGSIRDILETASQICGSKAVSKGIKIGISCDEDLKANLDPPLMEQAVVNLLDNAIKYSEANSQIRMEATREEHGVVVAIHDQGCGINKDHLPRVFERFYRVDKARSRDMGGTGLGLAIVKHIIQSHGGQVTVESSPRKGSSFRLHLPPV